MSKKLAEGSNALVLDVKCGDGAFMKDRGQAEALARSMVAIGTRAGVRTEAFITAASRRRATRRRPRSSRSAATTRGPGACARNVVASQVEIHRAWGGIVPELSARQHIRDICGVVERAVEDAGPSGGRAPYDLIAVTQGPGPGRARCWSGCRSPSRWPGRTTCRSCRCTIWRVTSSRSCSRAARCRCRPSCSSSRAGTPASTACRRRGVYERLGRTRDDAAGEAYDKVAKLLGLGYPGGPVIDRLAAEGNDRARGAAEDAAHAPDRNAPDLPGRRDFSFSGLKTSVARYVALRRAALGLAPRTRRCPRPTFATCARASSAWSWRRCSTRCSTRPATCGARSVGIAGGVSANSRLRRDALARGAAAGLPVFVPRSSLSTDNAAMIAAAGLRAFRAGARGDWGVNADASLPLRTWGRLQQPGRLKPAHVRHEDHDRVPLVQHQDAPGVRPHHRPGGGRRREERRARGHGAGVGHAHHRRRLRERLGGRPDSRLPGVAREAGAVGPRLPPSPDRRGQRRRAPEAHADGASGHPADHERQAGSRPVGAGVLRRVRRRAARSVSS